jgi:hypothetical protein
MLQDKPSYRPNIADIIGHDWVREPEAGEEIMTAEHVKQEMQKKFASIMKKSIDSQQQLGNATSQLGTSATTTFSG